MINAFAVAPEIATRHEAAIGRAMLRSVKAKPEAPQEPVKPERRGMRSAIIALLSDGRERTGSEIADRLSRYRRQSVLSALGDLAAEGDIAKTYIKSEGNMPRAYRIRLEAE